LFSAPPQNCHHFIIALLFFIFATSSLAEEPVSGVCEPHSFDNTYYLVSASDVVVASDFFQNMDSNYFQNLESFRDVLGHRFRKETYFDFRGLDILENNIELVLFINESLPYYRTEREKIIYRDNNKISSGIGVYEVKHYNKTASAIDKHPLFGFVKRKQRPELFKVIGFVSKEAPENSSEKLLVEHEEDVRLIRHYGVESGAITMDKFHIKNYGIPNTSMLFKIEVYPDILEKLTPQERDQLNTLFCQIDLGFRKQLPHIVSDSRFGYADYSQMASAMFPGRTLFQKYPVLFDVGQILILSFIGFLLLYLILGRYTKSSTFRKITYDHSDQNDDQ
jgi:hypothetical protein